MALLLAFLLAGELPALEQLPAPRFAETLPAPRFPAPALQRGPCSGACTCGCQSFGYCVCGSLAPGPPAAVPTPLSPAWLQQRPVYFAVPPAQLRGCPGGQCPMPR